MREDHQAKLVRWYKEEGDSVQTGDTLCEIETGQASVDIEAWSSGILWRLAKPGDAVSLGSELARIEPISN